MCPYYAPSWPNIYAVSAASASLRWPVRVHLPAVEGYAHTWVDKTPLIFRRDGAGFGFTLFRVNSDGEINPRRCRWCCMMESRSAQLSKPRRGFHLLKPEPRRCLRESGACTGRWVHLDEYFKKLIWSCRAVMPDRDGSDGQSSALCDAPLLRGQGSNNHFTQFR